MSTDSPISQVKLHVKLIVAKGTSFEWEQWGRMVTCLDMLGLPDMGSQGMVMLTEIMEKVWHHDVTIQELEQVVYEMFPDHNEKDLKRALGVPDFVQSKEFMLLKSLPVKIQPGQERKLVLFQEEEGSERDWVGLNVSSIEKIPSLESLISAGWNHNIFATIRNVRARTLRLVDYVFSSGKDFENFLLTGFPLAKFQLHPQEVWEDLKSLKISFKSFEIRRFDQHLNNIKDASDLVLTVVTKGEKMAYGWHGIWLCQSIKTIFRNPEFFGKNLCQCLEYAYRNVLFPGPPTPLMPSIGNLQFIGPENWREEIEEEMKKSKDAKKWYHDDIEEELFDTFHTRNYLDERDQERQAARAARLGGCPQTYHSNLECSCSYDMRATNHGYVDRTNWDSDWGAFSAGSD